MHAAYSQKQHRTGLRIVLLKVSVHTAHVASVMGAGGSKKCNQNKQKCGIYILSFNLVVLRIKGLNLARMAGDQAVANVF